MSVGGIGPSGRLEGSEAVGAPDTTTAASAAAIRSDVLGRDRKLAQVLAGEATLGPGAKGQAVRKVQLALTRLGLATDGGFKADGRWHRETEAALKRAQAVSGLPQSGRVDAATLAALDEMLSAAEARVKEGAADGSLSAAEIEKGVKEISAAYGEEKARLITTVLFGTDPAKLDTGAVDFIRGGAWGAMSGHIDRYQQVLAGHLAGAKLLDANFNGRIDKDDLAFVPDAGGKVNVQKIGQALADRVRVGAAMVDSAYAMADARHGFGDLRANSEFWKVKGGGQGTMHLKDGKRPSEALRDIFAHPDKYEFECATALVTLRYKAMLDLIGEKDFDRIMGDLRIGAWDQENDARRGWKISGRAKEGDDIPASAEGRAAVKPGEYTYFRNWDVSEAGYEAGWQGENVISLGDGLYYGHPFGIISGDEIVSYLNQHRKEGSTRSASLLDLRARIDPGFLKHDKDPDA